MGPLGVPNPAQPRGGAAVLTAPQASPGIPPARVPRQPDPPDSPMWPDSPQPVEPVRATAPPPAPAVPWAVPAPAAAPPAEFAPPAGFASPAEFAPPISPQYGDWARQQRVPGNVYGGVPPVPEQGPPSVGVDPSSSLSGQILGDGGPDDSGRGSTAVIVIMVVIGLLVIIGLVAAIAYLSGAFH